MKYVLLVLVILFVLFLFLVYCFRRRKAIRKVKCDTDEEKMCAINAFLEPFGFAFDLEQDIVVSRNDAWQREFGYRDLYDKKAPFLNMVMDCLPIFFEYDNKQYRIEFWKGQYGLTTGAEIGIYIKDEHTKDFYRAARDEERLEMTFLLVKKCQLFTRRKVSWWLTGFDVGVFSWPKDLKMKVCVQFLNCEMRDAFVRALEQAGYARGLIEICENTVCFDFCFINNYKPNFCHRIIKVIMQFFNWVNCHIYMFFTRVFNRTIDKLTYLRYMAPVLYRLILRLSVPRRKKKRYHKKCRK